MPSEEVSDFLSLRWSSGAILLGPEHDACEEGSVSPTVKSGEDFSSSVDEVFDVGGFGVGRRWWRLGSFGVPTTSGTADGCGVGVGIGCVAHELWLLGGGVDCGGPGHDASSDSG
jgi:hypothetical protein